MSEGLTRRRGAHPTSSGSTTPPTGSSLPATPQLGSSSTMHGVGGTPRGSLSGGGGGGGVGGGIRGAASSSSTTSAGGQGGSSSGGVEGRSKIAFDPRDYENGSMGGERERMPRLTVMEEVLLLGLKDKQVGPAAWSSSRCDVDVDVRRLTITGDARRATCLSGTTTSRTPSVAASSSNSHSDDE